MSARCTLCWRVVSKYYSLKENESYRTVCTECFNKKLVKHGREAQ